MIESYYKFDSDHFLGDYLTNIRKLKKLKIDYEDAVTSGGTDYAAVRGTEIGDPTFHKVEKLERISQQIKALEEYFRMYEYLIDDLSEEESWMIDYLKVITCGDRGRKAHAFNVLKNKLFVENNNVYIRLQKLRDKLDERAKMRL